jgi:hypothetical protein
MDYESKKMEEKMLRRKKADEKARRIELALE